MYLHKLRNLIRRCLPSEELDGQGASAGGAPAPAAAPAPVAEASPAAAPAPEVAGTPAAAPAGPATMLEAISQGLAQAGGQPRDEHGRFAPKTAAEQAQAAAPGAAPAAPAPAPKPAQAAAPAAPKPGEDPDAMPEGLTPQSQQRFQRLVSEKREVQAKLEELTAKHDEQVGYIRETFQRAGIQKEQFEQMVGLAALYNQGDYAGYQRALASELQRVQLLTGQAVQQVDALAGFADLRQAVDNAQITEAHAIEIARSREASRLQQHAQQQRQQVEQTQQAQQQAARTGMLAVDEVCRQLQATDIDYPAIEARLLPRVAELLQGVPPQQWAGVVRAQYQILKDAIADTRRSAGGGGQPSQVLRPTGAASTAAAPRTMFEAMFGPR